MFRTSLQNCIVTLTCYVVVTRNSALFLCEIFSWLHVAVTVCVGVQILCRELAVVMPRSERELRVPLEEKAAMAVWTIANQETFREISNLFGMNRGNAHFCIFQVLKVIGLQLKPEYVKWPSAIESRRIAAEFEESYGLAGVIGCLDGTHVQVKPPANDRDSYINRKGFPSINVMAVCDNSKTFRYVYADRAGSVHDARVLRVSSLGDMLENGTVYLSEDKENYHLLGDSAYPLLPNLIVPYRDNGHLTATQVRFNNIHSSTRSVIERAFGRLKGMFRRLRGVDCTHPMNALYMIEAAFVMHNFILYHEHGSDNDDIDNDVDGSDVPETSPATTSEFGTAAVRQAAREKRDKLAASL